MQCTVATLTLTSSLCVSCNRYLTLIEGAESYAVLRDSSRAVVSLPPVTNCDKSKVKSPIRSYIQHWCTLGKSALSLFSGVLCTDDEERNPIRVILAYPIYSNFLRMFVCIIAICHET